MSVLKPEGGKSVKTHWPLCLLSRNVGNKVECSSTEQYRGVLSATHVHAFITKCKVSVCLLKQ